MQEGSDHPLLIEPAPGGKIDDIDPAQLAIGRLGDKALDLGDRFRVGGLPQNREQPLGFARQMLGH